MVWSLACVNIKNDKQLFVKLKMAFDLNVCFIFFYIDYTFEL